MTGVLDTPGDGKKTYQGVIHGNIVKWQGRLVGIDLGRLRRLIEKSRDGVLLRVRYKLDLFVSCRAACFCWSPSEIAHPAIDTDRFVMTCLLVVPTGRPDYSAAMQGVSSVVAK